MTRRIPIFIVTLGIILSSCNRATVQSTGTIAPTGLLTPYKSTTPSQTVSTATLRVSIPVTPSPTSTPYIYIVKKNDTMLGIAYQFGITLEQLQAANPDVNPRMMGLGLKLIIPLGGVIPEILPTSTPMPADIKRPLCYKAGDGGAWCIAAVSNELEVSLENVAVWIGLYDANGDNFASQTAYAPLNILRPGETIPIMAYFSPPLPDVFQAQSEVVSSLPVAADDKRYLDLQTKIGSEEVSPDGTQAAINGEVIVPIDSPTISQLWVLAVAYDGNGNIVGERKWKSAGETNFEITVFSLGGMIDHVEVLIEARP